MPEEPNAYDELKGVDGIWSNYYIILLMSSYALGRIGDPKKLHIDCVCADETYNFCSSIQPMVTSDTKAESYPNRFGSMVMHKFSLRDIGIRASDMALTACTQKSPKKLIEYVDFTTRSYQ